MINKIREVLSEIKEGKEVHQEAYCEILLISPLEDGGFEELRLGRGRGRSWSTSNAGDH
jgi:hypothetical protein